MIKFKINLWKYDYEIKISMISILIILLNTFLVKINKK